MSDVEFVTRSNAARKLSAEDSGDILAPAVDLPPAPSLEATRAPHLGQWLIDAEQARQRMPTDKGRVRPRANDVEKIARYLHGLASMNHGVCWPTDETIARHANLKNHARATVQRTLRAFEEAGMLDRLLGDRSWYTAYAHGGLLPNGRYRTLALKAWTPRIAATRPVAEAILRSRGYSCVNGRWVPRVTSSCVGRTDRSSSKKKGAGTVLQSTVTGLPPARRISDPPAERQEGTVQAFLLTPEQIDRTFVEDLLREGARAVHRLFGWGTEVADLRAGRISTKARTQALLRLTRPALKVLLDLLADVSGRLRPTA